MARESVWRGSTAEDVAGRLEEFRNRIEKLDEQIVRLLNARAACVREIGSLKERAGMDIHQPARERTVLQRVRRISGGPLEGEAVMRVFERIIDESRRLERRTIEED